MLEIYLSEYVCPAAVLLVLIKPTNIMWVEDLYSAYVEAMVCWSHIRPGTSRWISHIVHGNRTICS